MSSWQDLFPLWILTSYLAQLWISMVNPLESTLEESPTICFFSRPALRGDRWNLSLHETRGQQKKQCIAVWKVITRPAADNAGFSWPRVSSRPSFRLIQWFLARFLSTMYVDIPWVSLRPIPIPFWKRMIKCWFYFSYFWTNFPKFHT